FRLHDPAPHLRSTLSLHDALPIYSADQTRDIRRETGRTMDSAHRRFADPETQQPQESADMVDVRVRDEHVGDRVRGPRVELGRIDRKSTRLNSSHVKISYAVFCLK